MSLPEQVSKKEGFGFVIQHTELQYFRTETPPVLYSKSINSSADVTSDFYVRSEPNQLLFAMEKVAPLLTLTPMGIFETLGSKIRHRIPKEVATVSTT
ncbi:TPA: hypothetical protein VGZ87_001014 [Streptococcus pyogenes]|nr:hypothetical protein [Streptococcus pyogenes]HEQ4444542.1 hypothetical protein [Streptococcus pyogenes]HEQ9040902.1 hypothetical protein [Streptococcus pyogenes]